ncbi:GNAT family N-acetyltransferase [Staphylococcus succinus]|uniref:GNAT family N-acetyltransferase n=2 Tax=Staphylococcus succinus TaxID=61015 RepID=A0A9Q6HPW2_9STAP|nr:GNAT family N-acetyltransferase [Staphylococcus succinus]PTI76045.1 GNAT family N-acetyltransferase [Staphylococcus succinus]
MSYSIEKVKLSEVEQLQNLAIQTFKNTFKDEEQYTDEDFSHYFANAYSVKQLTSELLDEHAFTYFYKEDEEVVGYFKLNINDAQTEKMGDAHLELQRIYFLPHAQGGGRGKHVFEFAIQKAKELNKIKIWLGVYEKNKQAFEFYKKQGLNVTGKHYLYTGSVEDVDLIMEKEI